MQLVSRIASSPHLLRWRMSVGAPAISLGASGRTGSWLERRAGVSCASGGQGAEGNYGQFAAPPSPSNRRIHPVTAPRASGHPSPFKATRRSTWNNRSMRHQWNRTFIRQESIRGRVAGRSSDPQDLAPNASRPATPSRAFRPCQAVASPMSDFRIRNPSALSRRRRTSVERESRPPRDHSLPVVNGAGGIPPSRASSRRRRRLIADRPSTSMPGRSVN